MRKILTTLAISIAAFAGAAHAEATATAAPADKAQPSKPTAKAAKKVDKSTVYSNLAASKDAERAKVLLEVKPANTSERMNVAAAILDFQRKAEAPNKDLSAHFQKLLDEQFTSGEAPEVALQLVLAAYGTDNFKMKDEKKALDILKDEAKRGTPQSSFALALIHAKGELGQPQSIPKAIEYAEQDTGPRDSTLMAFKAALYADESSPSTFDLEKATSTARFAHSLDKNNEHAVALLAGILMATKDEASVKEGQELITDWLSTQKSKAEKQAAFEAAAKSVDAQAEQFQELTPEQSAALLKATAGDRSEAAPEK